VRQPAHRGDTRPCSARADTEERVDIQRMSRLYDAGDDITLAFTTPVLSRILEGAQGLNRQLSDLILKRERANPSVDKSNIGGWHSAEDLLRWPHPVIGELSARLAVAIKCINDFALAPERESGEVELSAWATVLRTGEYHQPHFHPGCEWSGVYYVATGDSDPRTGMAGRIDMLDPRAGVGMLESPGNMFLGTLQFQPRAGMVLIFPGYLVHHVHPHAGCEERITVAFNARMLTSVAVGKGRRSNWW